MKAEEWICRNVMFTAKLTKTTKCPINTFKTAQVTVSKLFRFTSSIKIKGPIIPEYANICRYYFRTLHIK